MNEAKALRRALSRSGGFVLFKGFGMLPNKYALYVQKHCLQGRFVYMEALLAVEFVHTICARYRVIKLPEAVAKRWKIHEGAHGLWNKV